MTASITSINERVMISPTDIVTESSLRASISAGVRQLAKAISLDGHHVSGAPVACQQVRQWIRNSDATYDGRIIDLSWFRHLLVEEMDNLRYTLGENAYWAGSYQEAGRLFNELASAIN